MAPYQNSHRNGKKVLMEKDVSDQTTATEKIVKDKYSAGTDVLETKSSYI